MAGSRDESHCCIHAPDWLDYALSVLSMRIGSYKALDEESAESRTLNIRFVQEDREWVAQRLRPFVRDHLAFFREVSYGDKTLCRDAFIFDRFKGDLEASFKTVFIISRSSLADSDFVSMLRASFQLINAVKLQKILLVFLDEPGQLELPYGVKLYVTRKMPYLVWPERGGKKLKYFWKKFSKWTTINKTLRNPLPERCYQQSPWYQ